jgi:hypothetical protein
MAADQRYCLECGERRGAPRVPLVDGPAQRAQATPGAQRPGRRRSMSVNNTLIAGIGLLLLAMGIGVLIGRSGNNTSVRSPPAQIVTVAGAGAGAGAAASSTTATAPASTPSATPTGKSAGVKAAATQKAAKKAPTTPLPKTVKVGTPGHGPGYQNGHFTGNFFGE